jgi:hypothetical protein
MWPLSASFDHRGNHLFPKLHLVIVDNDLADPHLCWCLQEVAHGRDKPIGQVQNSCIKDYCVACHIEPQIGYEDGNVDAIAGGVVDAEE